MTTGTTTVDFGSDPVDSATFNFTDANLIGMTYVEPFLMGGDSTGDNDTDAHQQLGARCMLIADTPNGAGNVNFYADVFIGFVIGTFKIRWGAST